MKSDGGILNPRNFELQVPCTISFSKLREISEESFRKRSGDPGERKPSFDEGREKSRGYVDSRRGRNHVPLATPAKISRKTRKRKLLLWRRNFLENEIVRGGGGKLLDAKDPTRYEGDWMFNTSGNATLALGHSGKYCQTLASAFYPRKGQDAIGRRAGIDRDRQISTLLRYDLISIRRRPLTKPPFEILFSTSLSFPFYPSLSLSLYTIPAAELRANFRLKARKSSHQIVLECPGRLIRKKKQDSGSRSRKIATCVLDV